MSLEPMSEAVRTISRYNADFFADWLVAMGGWAPVSGCELPVLHRLIRTHNPDNRWQIPRRDLVITVGPFADTVQMSVEFNALYFAWDEYSKLSKRG